MLPSVGSIKRRIARPTVDLPQPDSPTRPSVSPRAISKLTPSTAKTRPVIRRHSPLLSTKYFLRSRISSSVSAPLPLPLPPASAIAIPVKLARAPAGSPVSRAFLVVSRIGIAAAVLGERATRREDTGIGQIRQCRDHAGNFLQPVACAVAGSAHQRQPWDRRHQPARVGMLRVGKELLDRRFFDLAPGIHHDDA